ncbi:SDR family oxidoreductase [Simiduia litorea]|uniref:SDR family oxidoreductase n=1 Tax=Simiduia litorea TaxID=1435348 RepID=UPI0036F249FD
MSQTLKDRVVIVTGAGAGIGWGITQVCAKAGATLVMAELNEAAKAHAEALVQKGLAVDFVQTDVSDPVSIQALVQTVVERYGRIDGLVNNAGVTLEGNFLDFPIEKLDCMWAVNQRSVFLMCQAVANVMAEKRSGAIVNIASNHAGASVPDYEMYAGTKAAIVAMSRAMAWSLGKFGVRVNSLSPGLTRTEAVQKVVDNNPKFETSFNAMHADGTYATVEEIGQLAAFLLSDLSSALTGSDLIADHGLSASLVSSQDLK